VCWNYRMTEEELIYRLRVLKLEGKL